MPGPLDTNRKVELEDLERQINDPDRYQGVGYQLAEDCLQAALLARGLELPQIDVTGRFDRAQRIAEKVGNLPQRLRIVYFRAWTVYWWYDDFEEFNHLYDQVEVLAAASVYAENLELLTNLWMILHTAVREKKIDPSASQIEKRTNTLKTALEKLAAEKERPNNALLALTHLSFIRLIGAMTSGKPLDGFLKELGNILVRSEGLVEFPFQTTWRAIREIGHALPNNSEYDKLFELAVKVAEKRTGQGEAGGMLLDRGYSQLEAGKKYDAIRLFGQAMAKSGFHEYRTGWIPSMAGCGMAYEAAGLLWAARANVLMVTNYVLKDYLKEGRIVPIALTCVQRLVWLELQLGRVFAALTWMETASLLAGGLGLDGKRKDRFFEERENQDFILGLLLLKTDLWELKWLDFLPVVLDKLGLRHSRVALLYALGYEDHLRSEGIVPNEETVEGVRDFFARWVNQPANEDLPDHPELMRRDKIILASFVLGCKVKVETKNTPISVGFAETIIAALEAFLATSLDARLAPYRSELWVTIQPSDLVQGLPEYEVNQDDIERRIIIRHAPETPTGTVQDLKRFRDRLMDIILNITFEIALPPDPDTFVEQVFQDERAGERALNYSDATIAIGNILGQTPKFSLSDWSAEKESTLFPLRRHVPWNDGLKPIIRDKDTERPVLQPGEGEPPADLFGIDNLRHKDLKILSLIDLPLWNKAKWRATLYAWSPGSVPVIALCFEDGEAAQQIFKGLRSKIGVLDEKEQLRVSVITGIDETRPLSYTVIVSTNLDRSNDSRYTRFVIVSRMNRMMPKDSRSLDGFLEQYRGAGEYIILPALFVDASISPKPFWELGIEKKELNVRPAWQIGENDPDVSAINEDDRPIIPDGVKDPPVARALQRFAKRRRRKGR